MTPEETNRELNLLRQELENTKQAKNHEIIELKHALNRAEIHIKTLEDKCAFVSTEYQALKQQYRQLELYTKERAHAMTQKHLKISQLEEKIDSAVQQKEKKMQEQIDRLVEIVRAQEEELSVYLGDHQNYVEEFQRTALAFRELQCQRNLLSDYNCELQKQISEVQTTHESLQSWVSNAYEELKGQNQQSGDLLNQIQYMMSSIQPENE